MAFFGISIGGDRSISIERAQSIESDEVLRSVPYAERETLPLEPHDFAEDSEAGAGPMGSVATAAKGEAGWMNEARTYSVQLTKTPMGLGLSLTDDLVTEIKPDSQAARDGRIKVGDPA